MSQSWLELPGKTTNLSGSAYTYYDGTDRNYTHFYDESKYVSYWTAYPLNSSHMGSLERLTKWYYSPSIDSSKQANLTDHIQVAFEGLDAFAASDDDRCAVVGDLLA